MSKVQTLHASQGRARDCQPDVLHARPEVKVFSSLHSPVTVAGQVHSTPQTSF